MGVPYSSVSEALLNPRFFSEDLEMLFVAK